MQYHSQQKTNWCSTKPRWAADLDISFHLKWFGGMMRLISASIAFPDVKKLDVIEAGESKNVPADARLFVLGFPRLSDLASAEGLLSNHYGPKGKWQTTLPIDYGNSGGPVFDIGGRVIGIAAGGLDEARAMTYVIPFDYARPLRSMVALMN